MFNRKRNPNYSVGGIDNSKKFKHQTEINRGGFRGNRPSGVMGERDQRANNRCG